MNATKGIKGIILDLRDNAGGVLQAGVECAGMFVNKHVGFFTGRVLPSGAVVVMPY